VTGHPVLGLGTQEHRWASEAEFQMVGMTSVISSGGGAQAENVKSGAITVQSRGNPQPEPKAGR
jgi:hypothetical protein